MTSLPRRLLLSAISGAFACGAAWLVWSRISGDSSIGLVNDTVRAQELLETRQASRRGGANAPASGAVPSLEQRSNLTADEAGTIFHISPQTFVHDRHRYYRYRPDLHIERRWEEHPDGRWTLDTNAQGLREDEDVDLTGLDRFVLVTGDSHVDGMCDNDESFANRVERELRAREPGKRIEVLNTGTSGYTFFNYLGALDEFLPFEPDTFVVTIYGGNDYLGNVMPQHFFSRTASPPRFESYWQKLEAARKASSSAVGMALNQVYYFQHYPDEVEVATESALGITGEIQRLCREHGIRLVWVYIPPLYDVDVEHAEEMDAAREILELSDYDMAVTDRITDAVLEKAREAGDAVVDLREEFARRGGSFYWLDGHINLRSHELIAELLLEKL